jgi:glycerophosphoryl diester phosphodiesterase
VAAHHPARHPFLDVPSPFVIAHRGFHPDGLENSMRAFAAAADLGVSHLETDVRATSDGVLVVLHDARVDRVTDAVGPVAGLTWRELRTARIGGSEPIPTLEEVLTTWPRLRVNVDLKAASAVRPFVQVVRRTGAVHRVCVASFSGRRTALAVRALRREGPVACSPAPARVAAVLAALRMGDARGAGRRVAAALGPAVCVQVPDRVGRLHVVTPALVEAVHAAGRQVHVWTIDDPATMESLLDLGVDAIVTNRADLALALTDRWRRRTAG